jgi:Holliday junction DNA helicase RuvA
VIAALTGTVLEKGDGELIVDVHGVGYRVMLSLVALGRLPAVGEPVSVRVRTVVREDAFDLYGFLTREEESLFLMLTSVSQVGPKLALTVLSGMEVEELAGALARGDVARLTKIHGVGKKTAERLVLELRDKAKLLGTGESPSSTKRGKPSPGSDLVSALVNLGYREAQADQAAQAAAARLGPEASFEALFREALKALRG